MEEEEFEYVSQGKRKFVEINILIYGRHTMYFYMVGFSQGTNICFCIDTIKVVSLMRHTQENLQLKSGRMRNIIVGCNKFKIHTCV